MADRDKMLIEELEKRLFWYREVATEEEFDAEAVDAICTMLEKLDPVEPRKKKEDTLADIMRRIRESEECGENGEDERESGRDSGQKDTSGEESDESKRRKGLCPFYRIGIFRAAVITIVMVGVLFSLDRVTYARENRSLFTMILEKVGWLEIEKEEGVVASGMMSGEFYNSWAELRPETKERLIVPDYIPEGYSLFGIEGWKYSNRDVLHADYYNQENGHLLIEIILWRDTADHYKEMLPNEDIYILLSEYSDKNTVYYEYEDEYVCMAFMENSLYRIYGNITLEEMIEIRKGLGGIG